MINMELVIKIAEEYGLEINKVEKGKGGMFYIDENNEKVNVDNIAFENDINMNIRLSQNNQYKIYGRRESMYMFAA